MKEVIDNFHVADLDYLTENETTGKCLTEIEKNEEHIQENENKDCLTERDN